MRSLIDPRLSLPPLLRLLLSMALATSVASSAWGGLPLLFHREGDPVLPYLLLAIASGILTGVELVPAWKRPPSTIKIKPAGRVFALAFIAFVVTTFIWGVIALLRDSIAGRHAGPAHWQLIMVWFLVPAPACLLVARTMSRDFAAAGLAMPNASVPQVLDMVQGR